MASEAPYYIGAGPGQSQEPLCRKDLTLSIENGRAVQELDITDAAYLSSGETVPFEVRGQHQDKVQCQSKTYVCPENTITVELQFGGQDEIQARPNTSVCSEDITHSIEETPPVHVLEIMVVENSDSVETGFATTSTQTQNILQNQSTSSLGSIDYKTSVDKEHTIQILEVDESTLPLGAYDRGETTRLLCIIGLVFAWLVIIACTLLGTLHLVKEVPRTNFGPYFPALTVFKFHAKHVYITKLSVPNSEFLSFLVNLAIALITDSLGYIHGTSLRWALFRDNRLNFNTNLRLFNSTRNHAPNRWPSNLICIASLIICYAASSQLILVYAPDYEDDPYKEAIAFNWIAILALAGG